MFEYISNRKTTEAIAGVHFALRCINYRKVSERLLKLRAADVLGGAWPHGDGELGLKIIEEIERAERAPLATLTDSKAEEYRRKLAHIVQSLTKETLEDDKGRGARLLDEWRNDPVGNIGQEELALQLSPWGVMALGGYLFLITLVLGLLSFSILTGRYLPLQSKVEIFMLSAALMGGLGSSIQALRIFSWYVGREQLLARWVWFFILRPLSGMALALIFSLVILGVIGSPDDVRVFYWGAAVSALLGLFSDAAVKKLSDLSHVLLRTDGDLR